MKHYKLVQAEFKTRGGRSEKLEACPAANAAEALQALRSLTKEGSEYAIIYIEEKLAQEISHEIEKHKDSPTPAIILIPGREGSLGLGKNALHEAVERAVGMNILGD